MTCAVHKTTEHVRNTENVDIVR